MKKQIGADFEPLIKVLQTISKDPDLCLDEQMALFELLLTGAEINPNCIDAVEISYALRMLQGIDLSERGPDDDAPQLNKDLELYFR